MSFLLAIALAGGLATQDPASLLSRIEALEARNRDLEARLERLVAEREQPAPRPAPVIMAAPPAAPRIPTLTPRDTWDASYVGGQISHGRVLDPRPFVSDFYAYSAPETSTGFVSLQFGRRWQSGSLVFGGEVSASAPIGPSQSELFARTPPSAGPDIFNHHRRTVSVAASGELGWAFGDTLLYSRVGIESAELVLSSRDAVPIGTNVTAPFFGLGVARQINPNWSLEVEGRYGYPAQGRMENDFALGLRVNYLVP